MPGATGGELVAAALVDAGVRHMVGMSGHSTLPLLDALYQHPSIRFVLARHEQTIGAMADGYARFTGRPGVCLVHVGPSAANLIIGVATAYRASSPVVALTCNEQVPLLDRDVFNSWDQLTPFSQITKWSARAHRAVDVPRIMRAAFVHALMGRPGPVQVDLPLDVLRQEAEPPQEKKPSYSSYSSRVRPDPDLLERVAALLAKAQRPVLLAGDGIVWSGGTAELVELAERTMAPVVVTSEARGAIPEDHPFFAGAGGGAWGGWDGAAAEALNTADLILGLGCRLADTDTMAWSLIPREATVVQVDAEPSNIARHYPVDLGLVSDARLFLRDLLTALGGAGSLEVSERAPRVRDLRSKLGREREQYLAAASDQAPLRHERVMREIVACMDKQALVTIGAGRHSSHASKVVMSRPRSQFRSGPYGAMGFAFPAAMGAKLAFPDAQVWCLIGDGDFAMTMQDVETAVRERLSVITVVFNDASYSSVQQIQRSWYGDRPIGVLYQRTDFAGFARLCGAYGARINEPKELGPALAGAMAAGRPAVIDVSVAPV